MLQKAKKVKEALKNLHLKSKNHKKSLFIQSDSSLEEVSVLDDFSGSNETDPKEEPSCEWSPAFSALNVGDFVIVLGKERIKREMPHCW